MCVRHLDESVVSVAIDDGTLFNPADLVLVCLHLEKSPVALQNLKRLSIHDFGHTLRNCRYPVVEIHLPRRNVDGFIFLVAKVAASRGKSQKTQGKRQKNLME